MASRSTFSDLTPPPLPGGGATGLMRQYSERFRTLFDASCLPLTAVAGTANAVTATLDPPLDPVGVLVDGMKFTLTWAAANTAGVTLAINGGAAIAVVGANGLALTAGAVGAGLRSLIEYIGGSFRILSPLLNSLTGGGERYFWQFTTNGTWNKPAGLDPDTMVFVEGWGAGGGGAASAAGGGGGAYASRWMRAGDLPSAVAVTIGAGGSTSTNGAAGGDSTFGSLLTAYGGGGAANGTNTGGGGGGALSAGLSASGQAGRLGGGQGVSGSSGNDATTENGGGSGAGASSFQGGGSLRGGGGGGAGPSGVGGVSIYGGAGGAANNAGVAPGGGGGRAAVGARGEIRVWI